MIATFGDSITQAFTFPYYAKAWTALLEQMSKSWIGERVAVLAFRRLLENVLYVRDDIGWGA